MGGGELEQVCTTKVTGPNCGCPLVYLTILHRVYAIVAEVVHWRRLENIQECH